MIFFLVDMLNFNYLFLNDKLIAYFQDKPQLFIRYYFYVLLDEFSIILKGFLHLCLQMIDVY